jgi:hypothetical protein
LLEDEIDPFTDDDELPEAELSDVTYAGETAMILNKGIDEDEYRKRWGAAPLKLVLAHPLQPSLEFLSPEQLSAVQAAHNHANLNGIAEALRKDDAWIKKTITFLLRSGYLAAG